jgi:hypothetical protein
MQELVKEGRKGMQDSEATLTRTEKLVEDTLNIGQQVGGRLLCIGAGCDACVCECVRLRHLGFSADPDPHKPLPNRTLPPTDAPQTAATLHDQTLQLNKIVDDLNEIEFTMKKASRVIADITKGIMTDKWVGGGGGGWVCGLAVGWQAASV